MKKIYYFILLWLCTVIPCQAAYFKNVPRQLLQPDGETLYCFVSGDEFYNWLHDENGYTIILDSLTGFYVYAAMSDGQLVSTPYIAGKTDPAGKGLQPYLIISPEERNLRRREFLEMVPSPPSCAAKSDHEERNHGKMNNIVIFIRFADDTDFPGSFSGVEIMFNDSADYNNSMYNYFKYTSYNQLFITSHFYPAPDQDIILSYQDSLPRGYYQPRSASNPDGYGSDYSERTRREHTLLERAVAYVENTIPQDLDIDYNGDSLVDNVCFVVKGSVGDWNVLLWPHRWSLYTVNSTIHGKRVWDYTFQLGNTSAYFNTSVLCHEMFHSLGAPDLYHYDDPSGFVPVGQWDLMEANANPPQQTNAHMKQKYGNWIREIPEITRSGWYTLYPLNSQDQKNICYKIASENPYEFYLLEYRYNMVPFENVPADGLVIYRINTLFDGNANFNNDDVLDEVYIFRYGGTPEQNGYISQAFFRNPRRTEFHRNSDPYPFLSDGTIGTIEINSVSAISDSITFYCKMPMDNSIIRYESDANITIYPNPATDVITIQLHDNYTDPLDVEVYDIYGRNVLTNKIETENTTVNCEKLSAGIYVVVLRNNQKIYSTSKIIKR